MSIQTYNFNIGNKYWTYKLQPGYIYPMSSSLNWWEEHAMTLGSTIEIDPGYTVLIQSLDQGPLIWSGYFINVRSVLTLYGIFVNYFNPFSIEGLPTEYMYATVTNLGQQSIELKQSDYLMDINTFGLM